MSSENQALKLKPHRLLQSQNAEADWLVETDHSAGFVLPPKYRELFMQASGGASIEALADRLLKTSSGNFKLLAKFLVFLLNHDLLIDRHQIRLAEQLKPDHVWPESIAFEELLGGELTRVQGSGSRAGSRAGSRTAALSWTVAVLVVIVGFASGYRWLTEYRALDFAGVLESAPGVWLLGLILSFSVARTFASLAQLFVLYLLSDASISLRIRLDAVSLSLSVEEAPTAVPTSPALIGSLGALLLLASSAIYSSTFSRIVNANVVGGILFFTPLVLLSDWSPFRKSPLTDWLRANYNRLAIRSSKEESPGGLEESIRVVQIVLGIVWLAGFAWFVRDALLPLIATLYRSAFALFELGAKVDLAALAVFALLIAIVLISFVDDLASGMIGGDARGIRARWRRKRPTMTATDAVRSGAALSRADLEALPILRSLDQATREKVISEAHVQTFALGEAACRQGARDRALHVLLSGEMAVARRSKSARRKVVALLSPGAVFGEAAFFFAHPRTADVIATEEARVLTIPANSSLTASTSRFEQLQLRVWFLQALVGSTVFKELPADALDALLVVGRKAFIKAGQKVFSEGETADSCYFIVQGQASVVQNTKLINRVKAGDVFGEIAILRAGTLRSATVIADSDLLMVQVDARAFTELLCSHLPLAVEIERVAEARLARDAQARN